jgi:hypothetical protein
MSPLRVTIKEIRPTFASFMTQVLTGSCCRAFAFSALTRTLQALCNSWRCLCCVGSIGNVRYVARHVPLQDACRTDVAAGTAVCCSRG